MNSSNSDNQITTILLDIEGTTTPIDFVYKTLFPYARAHIGEFIVAGISSGGLSGDLMGLLQEHSADVAAGHSPPPIPVDPEDHADSLIEYLCWLMDRDRKSTALKSIQGKIWESGYKSGELRSEVFPDVPPALVRWTSQGRDIAIYSSGSVFAQKLLFANTHAGDLTPFIKSYFDTNTGAKKDAESYRRIAVTLRTSPGRILFLSDVTSELDAASEAGLEALLCVRPGNSEQPMAHQHRTVRTFDDIFPA